jgi:hypothetical protein
MQHGLQNFNPSGSVANSTSRYYRFARDGDIPYKVLTTHLHFGESHRRHEVFPFDVLQ